MRALILCLLFLLGCDSASPGEALLSDYQRRIAGLTGLNVQAVPVMELPLWPAKRERLMPVLQQRASIAEWFRLRDCELFGLINERNSILGRVQQPSQRLLYEVEFIGLAKKCLSQLSEQLQQEPANASLQTTHSKLTQALNAKQEALPAVVWNSTVASAEFAAALKISAEPLAPDNSIEASAATAALGQWLEVQQKALDGGSLSSAEFEAANKALTSSRWLGQLYRGQQLAITTLTASAELLERRLERPLCFNKKPNRKSQAFKNVFQRYYAGEVQPYLAQLNNQQRQASELITSLFSAYQPPEGVQQWLYHHQTTLPAAFDTALMRHTKAWQALLGQCGLMPGSSGYHRG